MVQTIIDKDLAIKLMNKNVNNKIINLKERLDFITCNNGIVGYKYNTNKLFFYKGKVSEYEN